MSEQYTGSCLCGAVNYQMEGPLKYFQYCHCSRCQKVTGTAHAANIFVPPERFEWLTGEDQLGRFEHPEAKYYATSFCKQCGSNMPWLVQGGGNVVVPAGSLDQDPGIRPSSSLFWADRACWYTELEELPKFDAMPVRK